MLECLTKTIFEKKEVKFLKNVSRIKPSLKLLFQKNRNYYHYYQKSFIFLALIR